MRPANVQERQQIQDALRRAEVIEWIEELWRPIGIIDSYISDGPGFTGRVAVIVWGEPQFVTVCTNDRRENLWRIVDVEPVNGCKVSLKTDYESRVRAYEAQGMTRSDAQAVADAEDLR